jgi:hypothetical protein
MNHTSMRIALALAILAAGCRKAPDAAQPSPLQFETKSFEKVVPGCGDKTKREQPCVTFRVKWIEASAAPDAGVRAKINADIRARLQPKDAPTGFEAEAAAVAEEFARFQKEFPDSGITYFVRRSAAVSFSNAHLLSVEINEEDFKGGAHSNTHRDYLNLAPSTGESVTLAGLLVPDGREKLAALAENRFRAGRQIEAGRKLSEAGYSFAGDKFTLSRTWGVSAAGLVIHYNDYEIAPHSTGPATIELPWSEIRALIRKEAGLVPVN